MIISIKDNWKNAADKHTKYLNEIIMDFLNKRKPRLLGKVKAREFIEEIHHLVLLSSREDILESIDIYMRYKNNLSENINDLLIFNKQVKTVFNYNKFIRKTGEWNAYKLCEKSLTRTCPYCNHSFAFTIQIHGRGFRPTLDHFYSKDDFPHLALTLNNLVPSCNTCNSSLKGKKDFYIYKHLNPLWDGENLTFNLSHEDGVLNIENGIRISSENLRVNISMDEECPLSQLSLETFMLQERYSMLTVEAADFANCKLNFEHAKNSGIDYFRDIDESLLLRFDKNGYNKYILGKLYLDLYRQLDS
ncbi:MULTISPECIES: HNH endonuclease [unclassified Providencia]|uniref:HNH endonuclease n=1 Tax=unclassified Providencia TaxID=2633465 RepID=UPI00234AFF26|nr:MULTISPECIES: HNH endonuclease [unclassified Providencia]